MRIRLLVGLVLPVSLSACELFRDRDFPCELRSDCPVPPGATVDASVEDSREPMPDAKAVEDRAVEASDVHIDAEDEAEEAESEIGDAGPDGEAASDSSDAGCDLSKEPDAAPCVVDEQYGVFVAPVAIGTTEEGTRAHPYTSITMALQQASAARKRVYICDDGPGYNEQISLGQAQGGLQVFGGFDCAGWSYTRGRRTKITASSSPVVMVAKVSQAMVLADLDVVAPDATTSGASSVGVVVSESAGVVLRRVRITAGRGRDGVNGENGGGPSNESAAAGVRGNDGAPACAANPNPGGTSAPSTCGGVIVGAGGRGGDGATPPISLNGGDGVDGTPPYSAGKRGLGEPLAGSWSCSAGNGQIGTDGTMGGGGTGLGSLTALGWKGANGSDGMPGAPGQGGGGGGGAKAPSDANACVRLDGGAPIVTGASGGSGGSGGCGGDGGKGGMAGGSSIALMSVDSVLTLDGCDLVASDGGKGGSGGKGQYGGNGGSPGVGGNGAGGSNPGCPGGQGGKGGNGGAGGGGQGGHSLGVAYRGAPPIGLDLSKVQIGAEGAGGPPGTGSVGKGDDGIAVASQPFSTADGG